MFIFDRHPCGNLSLTNKTWGVYLYPRGHFLRGYSTAAPKKKSNMSIINGDTCLGINKSKTLKSVFPSHTHTLIHNPMPPQQGAIRYQRTDHICTLKLQHQEGGTRKGRPQVPGIKPTTFESSFLLSLNLFSPILLKTSK